MNIISAFLLDHCEATKDIDGEESLSIGADMCELFAVETLCGNAIMPSEMTEEIKELTHNVIRRAFNLGIDVSL